MNLLNKLKVNYGINQKTIKKIKLLSGVFQNNCKITIVDTRILEFYKNLQKNKIFYSIENLKFLKNYRGMRHILKLPVRGQRTHTNSKTSRRNVKKQV